MLGQALLFPREVNSVTLPVKPGNGCPGKARKKRQQARAARLWRNNTILPVLVHAASRVKQQLK
jgi:hypothetical protein